MIDFAAVNAAALSALPSLLQRWFPTGFRVGPEFKVGNLRGDPGDSLSINLNSGRWADFASDEKGGDPVSLYAAMHRIDQAEAAKALAAELRLELDTSKRPRLHVVSKDRPEAKPEVTVVMPVPDNAPAPSFAHTRHGVASAVWEYRDDAGKCLGFVCRFDKPEGHKEVLPLTFGSDGRWHWRGFPRPRPLFGLDRLAARPDAPVLVVEGEKCADAAAKAMPGYVAVTYNGGTHGARIADWTALKGRAVTIWPDADEPGHKAAAAVLRACPQARVVTPPEGVPPGWDIADAIADGWTVERLAALVEGAAGPTEGRGPDNDEPAPEPPPPDAWPFRCLGYDRHEYFYLPRGKLQVVRISASGHSPQVLNSVAPQSWWEMNFGCEDKKGWAAAIDSLFRAQEKVGPYDPGRVRGLGAWFEAGSVVLHAGDALIVDGVRREIVDHSTRYIYERLTPVDWPDAEPLPAAEAVKLAALCARPNWESALSGPMLAGWLVIAPICGALEFRPHVLITGQSSSGKSWVMNKIVSRVLGNTALYLAASVTEPGVRRALGSNSRPVIIDEFEAKDRFTRQRVQAVLDLMRYSTTETDAKIVKGNGSGGADYFHVRSCFLICAINNPAVDAADANRIQLLKLRPNEQNPVHFAALQAAARETLTDEFLLGLRARAIKLIPTIRRNAITFGDAAAEQLHSRRLGDGIGALLAGYYALHSGAEVTPEAARQWIARQDWAQVQADTDQHDGLACLAKITSEIVRVQTARAAEDHSISDLIDIICGNIVSETVMKSTASQVLRDRGIAVLADGTPHHVLVANRHPQLAEILKETQFVQNWAAHLRTVPGAQIGEGQRRWGSTVQRYTTIPWPVGG